MTQLLNGPWRSELAEVVSNAKDSLLLAAPFIKRQEADWLCELVPEGVEVTTLANINPDAVSSSALDMAALERLAEASESAKLFALSSLHAKVFIADDAAIVRLEGRMSSPKERTGQRTPAGVGRSLHLPHAPVDSRAIP